jgi:hypothetical protein
MYLGPPLTNVRYGTTGSATLQATWEWAGSTTCWSPPYLISSARTVRIKASLPGNCSVPSTAV